MPLNAGFITWGIGTGTITEFILDGLTLGVDPAAPPSGYIYGPGAAALTLTTVPGTAEPTLVTVPTSAPPTYDYTP